MTRCAPRPPCHGTLSLFGQRDAPRVRPYCVCRCVPQGLAHIPFHTRSGGHRRPRLTRGIFCPEPQCLPAEQPAHLQQGSLGRGLDCVEGCCVLPSFPPSSCMGVRVGHLLPALENSTVCVWDSGMSCRKVPSRYAMGWVWPGPLQRVGRLLRLRCTWRGY